MHLRDNHRNMHDPIAKGKFSSGVNVSYAFELNYSDT